MTGRLQRSKRSLVASLVVGTIVSVGNLLWPGAPWWPLVYAVLPAVVFTYGAFVAGRPPITKSLVARAALTVCGVVFMFSMINNATHVDLWIRGLLNYAVPFVVASIGAARPKAGVERVLPLERR